GRQRQLVSKPKKRSPKPKGFGDLFVPLSVIDGREFAQKPAALQQRNRLRITTHAPIAAPIGRCGYALASHQPAETSGRSHRRLRNQNHRTAASLRYLLPGGPSDMMDRLTSWHRRHPPTDYPPTSLRAPPSVFLQDPSVPG